jgi:hypothetical protein
MKTRTTFILSLTTILTLAASTSFAKYSGGTGEIADPYQIGSAADLVALGADVNDYNKHFVMTADIDLDPNLPGNQIFIRAIIAPDVNNSNEAYDGNIFTGVFDGNGHTISNLTIKNEAGPYEAYVGLFGYAGSCVDYIDLGTQIKNLRLENVNISGTHFVGALVGHSGSTISNCSSTGIVNGGLWAGGLIGYNIGGPVSNCRSTARVVGGAYIGGLVGYFNDGYMSFCYFAGSVAGTSDIGGLAGYDYYGTISRCYSTADVSGGDNLGGLVGLNLSARISNCYSTGAVSGNDALGGLVGWNWHGSTYNSYSTGIVTGDSKATNLGGLVGGGSDVYVINNYFLLTSGPNNGYGTPLTDSQMKQKSSFVGWDFVGEKANGIEDIWWINEGNGYPALVWQPTLIQVTKCTVAAGYGANSDKISVSGRINATADDFGSADIIEVAIDSNSMNSPCNVSFTVDANTFKKGKYNYSKTVNGARKSFRYDPQTGKFTFSASHLDLSGLGCPVIVKIKIGDCNAAAEVYEDTVNAKKLCPYQLMMGVKNLLMADKVRFKRSTKPDANSLTISGRFTTTGEPNLANPMVITVGSQTFTVPGNQFLSKNGIISCKAAVVNKGPLVRVTAKFNYLKCTYAISVKYASILQSGVVDFGIDCFGVNLDGLETITLN